MKKALLLLLLTFPAFADQVAVSEFQGLNNNESSLIIGSQFAQDLLNVDVTPGGKSVKKRPGFGVYKDIDEGGLHGGIHFFDSTGNDVQVWGSSQSLTGIVADGTPTVLVSSATLGSTWDCEDIQGFAYCVNSSRNLYVRTNGVTIAWQTAPLGTMIASTPDRVVVAGVAAAPSSLYVSAANTFIAPGWTVGNLNSDAFVEPIAAPGSKLTHIRWGCGKLLWWKDQSFGYTNFEDQYTLENKIISDNIGTFDNTSAIDPGGNIWFRGQDGHIWRYDCSGLTKESIEITPNIQASGRRVSNSFAVTTQAEWNGGSGFPANTMSTTTVVDAVTPTTFTVTENSNASGWSSGSTSNVTVWTSSIALTLNNSGNVDNASFEDAGTLTTLASSWTISGSGANYARSASNSVPSSCGAASPHGGSFRLVANRSVPSGEAMSASLLDASENVLTTTSVDLSVDHCAVGTWYSLTISSPAWVGKRAKVRLSSSSGGNTVTATLTNSFVLGGAITVWYRNSVQGLSGMGEWDDLTGGSSTVTSGQFTSQAFNTGAPFSFVHTSATWTGNTSSPTVVLQKSASASGPWLDINGSTGTNVTSNQRFLRYLSSFTISGSDDAKGYLSGVQIIAKSSGPYYSAVKNAPNIASWSTFNPSSQLNDGTIVYNIRRATQTFSIFSSTPSAWTPLTPNALITASTGTYFQIIASFSITAATTTPSVLNDFTVNWFEGSASDQAYMHYFDNAIWSSVAFGVGVSSNTHIFKRDLINDGWTVYNFGAGGMMTQNNRLYFGDVSSGGNIFLYGSGTADNSSAINAYWKSKDFTASDPFLEVQLGQIDTIVRRDPNQTLSATYTLNTSSSTSYSIALSSTTNSIITHRKLLPSGKNGYTFNIQQGNNSTTGAFELMGYRIGFTPQPYRPSQ